MRIEKTDEDEWLVEGKYHVHDIEGDWWCDCRDFFYRHQRKHTECKHIKGVKNAIKKSAV